VAAMNAVEDADSQPGILESKVVERMIVKHGSVIYATK
jgi:hypothetical protein